MTEVLFMRHPNDLEPFNGSDCCAALSVFNCDIDFFNFTDHAVLQRVEVPHPYGLEQSGGIDEGPIFGVYSYIQRVSHEIVIDGQHTAEFRDLLKYLYVLSLGLRISSRSYFLVPFVFTDSLNVVGSSDLTDSKCFFLENVPNARGYGAENPEVSLPNLQWVRNNASNLVNLLAMKRFGVAAASFTTASLNATNETVAANYWMGMDALFAEPNANNFRSAIYAAAFLEEQGEARWQKFKEIRQLYNERNDIIHGELMSLDELTQHIIKVRNVLADTLVMMTERNNLPGANDYQRRLFNV